MTPALCKCCDTIAEVLGAESGRYLAAAVAPINCQLRPGGRGNKWNSAAVPANRDKDPATADIELGCEMAGQQFEARMLYDFQAVAEDELSVAAGSVVTITDTEQVRRTYILSRQEFAESKQGQGWWLALDRSGQQGKVPETYCERVGERGEPPAQEGGGLNIRKN